MKTMKNFFLVMIAVFTASIATASSNANADGNLKVNLTSNNTEAALVEISTTEIVNFEIELFDEFGNLIYNMETEAPRSELNKRYNFTKLEDGEYVYRVQTGNEKVTKQMMIENGEVEVVDIRKSVAPTFIVDGDMVKLSYLNFENEDVTMYVYDNNSKLLNETELGSNFTIHKAVNIAELERGSYEIILANNYDIYEHRLVIE